jgi:hypothetical protein
MQVSKRRLSASNKQGFWGGSRRVCHDGRGVGVRNDCQYDTAVFDPSSSRVAAGVELRTKFVADEPMERISSDHGSAQKRPQFARSAPTRITDECGVFNAITAISQLH